LGVLEKNRPWSFSADPAQRISIQSLAVKLQQAELAKNPARAKNDPWYDGHRHNWTLVAAPWPGTVLTEKEMLGVVKRWGKARPVPSKQFPGKAMVTAGVFVVALMVIVFLAKSRPPQDSRDHQDSWDQLSSDRMAEKHRPDGNQSDQEPAMWCLSVGISTYKDERYNLDYPANDAKLLKDALEGLKGKVFKRVGVKPLIDDNATKNNIQDSLDRVTLVASPSDLIIVYLAGHGKFYEKNDERIFYFLPWDYDLRKSLVSSSISWDLIETQLRGVHCPVIVILDTCHAGTIAQKMYGGPSGSGLTKIDNVSMTFPQSEDAKKEAVEKALQDFKKEAKEGTIGITACFAEDTVKEYKHLEHSALALALLEAISGQRIYQKESKPALPQETGRSYVITLEDITEYTKQRVEKLLNGKQKIESPTTKAIRTSRIPITVIPSPSPATVAAGRH
jgi:uncharacterized caspase-like protein